MEYQFENVRQYNRKRNLEFYYRVLYRRILFWGVVSLALMARYIYLALSDAYWWLGTVVCAGLAVHYFSWPYRLERKQFKRALDYYDGQIPASCIRFGDQIFVEDSDSTFNLEYRKIEKVIVLKHGLFLRYAQKSYLCVDPQGFTKGTLAEFKQFLRQKRPDLKIPD